MFWNWISVDFTANSHLLFQNLKKQWWCGVWVGGYLEGILKKSLNRLKIAKKTHQNFLRASRRVVFSFHFIMLWKYLKIFLRASRATFWSFFKISKRPKFSKILKNKGWAIWKEGLFAFCNETTWCFVWEYVLFFYISRFSMEIFTTTPSKSKNFWKR